MNSPNGHQPGVYTIESKPAPDPFRENPDFKENIRYVVTPEPSMTEEMLQSCSDHYSLYYGKWADDAVTKVAWWAVKSSKFFMTRRQLQERCLPKEANNILICAMTQDNRTVGHCFVSQWNAQLPGYDKESRVWWITQLLVLPNYRNQLKATRMLRTLSQHYNIGKLPDVHDYVGMFSMNPYAICAALHVFGRGIESVPLKYDYQKDPQGCPHAPLPVQACKQLLRTSPIPWFRELTTAYPPITVHTNHWVDHEQSDIALAVIMYRMNKLWREPWEWPFEDLREGCEWMCVLKYKYDSEYDVQSRIMASRPLIPRPTGKQLDNVLPPRAPSPPVRYSLIDAELSEHPNPISYLDTRKGEECQNTKWLAAARTLVLQNGRSVKTSMHPKAFPSDLRLAYFQLESREDIWQWRHLFKWAALEKRLDIWPRLELLQALHFIELRREAERDRSIAAWNEVTRLAKLSDQGGNGDEISNGDVNMGEGQ